ncbi:MAG: hypothetical protein IJP68_02300 [Selenomonadaceae bacterium]|nr:hypothetical protein [Selenomonadaceae bacterium]
MNSRQTDLYLALGFTQYNVRNFSGRYGGRWLMEQCLNLSLNDSFYAANVRPNELTSEMRQTLEDSFVLEKERTTETESGRFMGYKALRVGFNKYLEGMRSGFSIVITPTAYSSLWEEDDDD